MKKTCFFVALCLCLSMLTAWAGPAAAESAPVVNFGFYSYQVREDGSALLITYTGPGKEIVLPETLEGYPVTAMEGIGSTLDGKYLESVTIPNTLTEFTGGNPFAWCEKLRTITVAEDHPTLEVRDGMLIRKADRTLLCCPGALAEGEMTVPEGVLRIADNAFSSCVKMTSLTIPAGVTEIEGNPFHNYNGTALTEIIVDAGNPVFTFENGLLIDRNAQRIVHSIPELAGESVTIPEGIRAIGPYAFANNGTLKEVRFPAGLETIREYAFYYCKALTAAALPEGLKTLENYAFYSCSAMTEAALPDGLETIGSDAFGYCSALETISPIPDSVTSIGGYAFSYCPGIREVTIPAGVAVLSNGMFYNCRNLTKLTLSEGLTEIGKNIAYESQLAEVIMPDTVTTVADSAFSYLKALEKVKFPKDLKRLPDSVCSGCSSLKEVILPENLEDIGRDAFYSCGQLVTLELPETVKTIQFRSMNQLRYLVIPASVEYIGEDAVPSALIIPEGSEMEYYCKLNHKQMFRTLEEAKQAGY